jgi:hypothetical protein
MNTGSAKSFPSAAAKVRLLQDAVYSEDMELWATLLRFRSHIESYFQEIGLQLIVHEEDGFAYLKQSEQDDGAPIPRLFRRDKLSRGVAVLGVLLRERLLQFDENIHDESRLIVAKGEIIQMATPFFPETNDEVRADKRIESAINRAEEMGLLRKLPAVNDDEYYEVRRIIKARFPVETLKALREQLEAHANTLDGQQ